MKNSSYLILVYIVIFMACCSPNKRETVSYVPSDSVIQVFEKEITAFCSNLNINRLSYAVVNNENIIQSRNISIENGVVILNEDDNSTYQIGNISETMASIILLQQFESGKVDLKDYLSEHGINDGKISKATIKQLLSNTYFDKPGTSYNYDPQKSVLLKKVIETITDDDYANQLEKRIFNDCDFENTTINNNDIVQSTVTDLARFSIVLDNNELFDDTTTTELMYRPVYLKDGEITPSGLGWFIQIYNDKKYAWSFGLGEGYSSLIIKSLSDSLTFIILANSTNLNTPFNLDAGNLMKSPIATSFLKTFSFHNDTFPDCLSNQSDSIEKIAYQNIKKSKHRNFLINELKANIVLFNFIGNISERDRLAELYTKYFTNDLPFELLVKKPRAIIENISDYVNVTREFLIDTDTIVNVFTVGEFVKELTNNPWEYDNIEIFLDLHNTKKDTFDNRVDRHYRVTCDYPELTGNYSTGDKIVFSQSDPSKTKYIIEISMPWTTLDSIKPFTGNRLGFEISAGDNDGNLRETCINWLFEKQQRPWENTSIYGTLLLTETEKGNVRDSVCVSQKSISSITIDGKIDCEWNKATTYSFTRTTSDAMPDKKDFSGTFKTMWDNQNLYFLVELTDDFKKLLPTSADYGWIENSKGDTVWAMTPENTLHAGGALTNRFVNTIVKLKKDKYTLHYSSNQSNSYARWTAKQPDVSFYGIAVY